MMREADIIKATASPLTIDTLYHDFMNLGVNIGDVLLVHSSLSRIGWVCGGAQSVVMALLKATGADGCEETGGTLVMPAHSGDWSDPAEWQHPPVPKEWIQVIYDNMPAYNPGVTPTRGMGRIAELFRIFPGVARSDHPQVSFCAVGRSAVEIVKGHRLTPQFGMDSPLGKMYNLNAKVLLLGVGYDSCTSFHLAETKQEGMPMKRMGTTLMEDGARVWKWFEDYAYDNDDFNRIGEAFEESSDVLRGKIGNAESRLFDMKSGVDFAEKWLRENRFNKKGCIEND